MKRISLTLFFTCLALLVMSACRPTTSSPTPPPATQASPALVPGSTTRSLSYGGESRTYILYVPSGYTPSQPTPVVLIFHGFGLNGEEMIRITGFNAQADTSRFIAVYPNGSGRTPAWNGGDCCGEAAVRKVDDVGFVRALIEDLSKLANIDRKRIYATGFSNGAIMAYRLACDLSDQIAAIAPVSATQATQTCQPKRPVSVIHFHGTNDRLNPYNGGVSSGGVRMAPVKETVQFWVKQNGCPAQAQAKQSGNITSERYSPCAQDTAVELYTIVGGEHAWPGGQSVTTEIGVPTKEISATPLIWEFFVAHPMP